jgi:hypothetical protein
VYPEEGSAAPPQGGGADYYPGGGIKSKLAYHLEGLVPIILIIIIALFLAVKFDVVNTSTPVLGIIVDIIEPSDKVNILIISDSSNSVSVNIRETFNVNSDIITYRIRPASDLTMNPKQKIDGYDIIMLEGLTHIPYSLGQAIVDRVKGGGKLITVKGAGIRRGVVTPTGEVQGYAPDVLGWEETFDDLIPVNCENSENEIPGCTDNLIVSGKLYREEENHEIMKGFEEIPPEPNSYKNFEVLNVNYTANELAYIRGSQYQEPLPGIVEKKMIFGKSIYFNYDPGTTPGLLISTIEYLK